MSGPDIARERRLTPAEKMVFALGDHTVNLVLSAASLLYLPFLTEIAGIRPAVAGGIVWLARVVDAVTDPAMGRISDRTRLSGGRRRPYFLIGALPFGAFFALMWASPELGDPLGRAAYYTAVYVAVSVSMTVLSVPYLALIPEMAPGYDERTSLNTYRSAAALLGTFGAVAMKAIADGLGGGAEGWWQAACLVALWLVAPWLAVHRVSFERPQARSRAGIGFVEGARALFAHRSYRLLCGLFLFGRIAVDMVGAMFLLYFTYWLGRAGDFEPALTFFLSVTALSLIPWLWVSRRSDKRTLFVFGCAWWIAAQLLLFAGGPEWPRWIIFAIAGLAAIGYAVADLMPWAMLGEVVDEDELRSGERREGMYVGFFTFLRKLGGATAVLIVGVLLDYSGYRGGLPREEQSESVLETIRVLMSLVPAFMLAIAIGIALGYPLTRAAHARIVEQLHERRARPDSAAG